MKKPQCTAAFLRFSYAPIDKMQKNGIILSCENRTISSVGQSSRLITDRSRVRVPEGPPYRGIAQLVEQRSPKPRVESSNLSAPAIFLLTTYVVSGTL